MKIVDEIRKAKINEVLPSLKKLMEKDETDYQMLFVSVFDHWLTQYEFESQIHTEDQSILEERRNKLNDYIKVLFSSAQTFKMTIEDSGKFQLSSFENLDEIVTYCNIKEQHGESGQRYDIILPAYQAVYSEEWDWTNIIWFRDKSKITPMLQLLKECGLHILNKKDLNQ